MQAAEKENTVSSLGTLRHGTKTGGMVMQRGSFQRSRKKGKGRNAQADGRVGCAREFGGRDVAVEGDK